MFDKIFTVFALFRIKVRTHCQFLQFLIYWVEIWKVGYLYVIVDIDLDPRSNFTSEGHNIHFLLEPIVFIPECWNLTHVFLVTRPLTLTLTQGQIIFLKVVTNLSFYYQLLPTPSVETSCHISPVDCFHLVCYYLAQAI